MTKQLKSSEDTFFKFVFCCVGAVPPRATPLDMPLIMGMANNVKVYFGSS